MTRMAKLYGRLIARQLLTFAEFERLLSAFGYIRVAQRGSHVSWRHPATRDKRIIQPNGKDAKRYQLDQFLDIIEKLALTLDDGHDG